MSGRLARRSPYGLLWTAAWTVGLGALLVTAAPTAAAKRAAVVGVLVGFLAVPWGEGTWTVAAAVARRAAPAGRRLRRWWDD